MNELHFYYTTECPRGPLNSWAETSLATAYAEADNQGKRPRIKKTSPPEQMTPMGNETSNAQPPKVFLSYSWDSDEHKKWVKELAARLRGDGVDVTLDQWKVVPGDQLPKFMETAIRDNAFVLIICTPSYKRKSDDRTGGVGYEGDIMTGEVFTEKNDRKFIGALRSGAWTTSMPSWLKGKYAINLSGDPYAEEQYHDLLVTLHNRREQEPPIGKAPHFQTPLRDEAKKFYPKKETTDAPFEPITIEGVLADEAGRPKNDGSGGSALYAIPFKLNRAPTHEWGKLFGQTWDHPPQYTTRHRPGIAHVQGDRIVLRGTTIEEVRDVHRTTLKLVVDAVNKQIAERIQKLRETEEAAARQELDRQDNMRRVADEIKFD